MNKQKAQRGQARKTTRRSLLAALGAAGAAGLGLAAPGSTRAAAPAFEGTGVVRLVITFPPGGSTDIAARMMQPKLSELLGVPVIVENKPGAASQLATQYVARAPADGRTLLVCFDTHSINPVVKPNLPYDTFKDFAGVAFALRFPLVIGASAATPGNDLREFLAAAKRAPGKYSYASTGLGSMNHLVAEDLKRRADVDLLHVPYGGGGPAVQAVLGDVTNLTLLSYAALGAHITSGRIKALAVAGTRRSAALPQVPTVAESGFPGFEAYSWIGIFAPAATPAGTLSQLTQAFQATLKDPEVSDKLTRAGFEIVATDGPSVDRYAREQYDRWRGFVTSTGLKLD